MNLFWFLRMTRWVRHPPSAARVKLVIAVALACLGLALFAHYVYWPDWARTNTNGRMPRIKLH